MQTETHVRVSCLAAAPLSLGRRPQIVVGRTLLMQTNSLVRNFGWQPCVSLTKG